MNGPRGLLGGLDPLRRYQLLAEPAGDDTAGGGSGGGSGTEPAGEPAGGKQEPAKPPWGDDKDFDPAKAWKLIEDTRSDRQKLKDERDALKTKVDAAERAQLSETQKLEKDLAAAQAAGDKTQSEVTGLKMAIKYHLDEDDLDLLGTGTAEQIEARAKRLAEKSGSSTDAGAGGAGLSKRPKEQLRGGGRPSDEVEETNPKKLADQIPRGF